MHSQFRNDNLVIICCDHNNGSVAQLNRALDYGSRGYRFESCRNHKRNIQKSVPFFLFSKLLPLNLFTFELWALNIELYDMGSRRVDRLTSWQVNCSDKLQLTVVIIICSWRVYKFTSWRVNCSSKPQLTVVIIICSWRVDRFTSWHVNCSNKPQLISVIIIMNCELWILN